jgi:hypothetical protein
MNSRIYRHRTNGYDHRRADSRRQPSLIILAILYIVSIPIAMEMIVNYRLIFGRNDTAGT